jgi:hypothetical protein
LKPLNTFIGKTFQELKFFENTGEMDSRKFVSVMTNFHNLASYNFSEIEEAKGEIRKKVSHHTFLS